MSATTTRPAISSLQQFEQRIQSLLKIHVIPYWVVERVKPFGFNSFEAYTHDGIMLSETKGEFAEAKLHMNMKKRKLLHRSIMPEGVSVPIGMLDGFGPEAVEQACAKIDQSPLP
jgi:hypothetical protein